MSIKISGTDAVDNNRRGIFQKVNPGVFTTSQANSLSKSEGDVIYNSNEKVLQVWNGSAWVSAGGGVPFVGFTGEEQTWVSNGYLYVAWGEGTGTISVSGSPLKLEALIIGGGGGGGAGRDGGGGGAGGVLVTTVEVPTTSPAPIRTGGGGAGMPAWTGYSLGNPHTPGTRGTPSYVGSSVAGGGGSLGGWPSPNIRPGGSGAGGSFVEPGGSGTPGQGNPGGTGTNIGGDPENSNTCGGGGGAGGAGQSGNSPSRVPGQGGAGLTIPQLTPKNTLYPGVAWDLQYSTPLFLPGFAGGGSGHGGTFPYNPGTRPANPIGGGGPGRYPTGTIGQRFGSGGGGGGFRDNNNSQGGAGYRGVVVIRYRISP